jgi:hypothetical protein
VGSERGRSGSPWLKEKPRAGRGLSVGTRIVSQAAGKSGASSPVQVSRRLGNGTTTTNVPAACLTFWCAPLRTLLACASSGIFNKQPGNQAAGPEGLCGEAVHPISSNTCLISTQIASSSGTSSFRRAAMRIIACAFEIRGRGRRTRLLGNGMMTAVISSSIVVIRRIGRIQRCS